MGFTLNQHEQEKQIKRLQQKEDHDTTNYEDLDHLPQINSVELKGNKSLDDLGIASNNVNFQVETGTTLEALNTFLLSLSPAQLCRAIIYMNDTQYLKKSFAAEHNMMYLGSTQIVEYKLQYGETPHYYRVTVEYGTSNRVITEASVTSWEVYYNGAE